MASGTRVLMAGALLLATACGGGAGSRESGAVGDSAAMADSSAKAAGPVAFKVSNVMIGKRVGAEDRITEPTFQFAPLDTVFVSVGTEGGTSTSTLAAKWVSQAGKVVDSTVRDVAPDAKSNTEFHVVQPKGWAPGIYKVMLYANGDSADTKTFVVKK